KQWFAGKGEDVKQLQVFLRNKGYLDGKYVTGYFGAITRDALTNYMYGNKKVSQPSVAKTAGTSGQGTGGSGGLIGEFKKIPSTIASGVKGGVGAFNEAVEKQPVAASVIGILNEPADWAVTFSDWGRGDFRATDITALLPILSHGMVRSAGNALDAASIRFTQDSISATFKDGRTVDQLTNGLRSGTIAPNSVPSIRIFEQNGNLYTLDNRRLYSFQQAGVPVPYRMATLDEILNESWKFTSKNDGVSIIVRGR
ncbi:peptidoglycan-binding domain-containing protein, partial [Phosphitispora fastidiosa]|uniref:peptidoglycan-binding domain-containing protein n=1 Tax=Phosphitispora fastidiosa TaxID=2837202 RepID=UPI001E3609AA